MFDMFRGLEKKIYIYPLYSGYTEGGSKIFTFLSAIADSNTSGNRSYGRFVLVERFLESRKQLCYPWRCGVGFSLPSLNPIHLLTTPMDYATPEGLEYRIFTFLSSISESNTSANRSYRRNVLDE